MAYSMKSSPKALLMQLSMYFAHVSSLAAADSVVTTTSSNVTGIGTLYTADGAADSTDAAAFSGTKVVTGSAAMVIWHVSPGNSVFKDSISDCRELFKGGEVFTGISCVINALAYLVGLGVALTSGIYFSDYIVSGPGRAIEYLTGIGARDINDCEVDPASCELLTRHIIAHLPSGYEDHRVTHVTRDNRHLVDGKRFTITHPDGMTVATFSANSTHHVMQIGHDGKPSSSMERRTERKLLPTENHYWQWGRIAGIKAQGVHRSTPADPPTFLENTRKNMHLEDTVGGLANDVASYTVCSDFTRKKIYEGKFVFEKDAFGHNYESYIGFDCPS